MSVSTQYTSLYNGDGFVYVTGPSGTFPATADERMKWSYPDYGIWNYPQSTHQVMYWALRNVPDNGSGYATFIITVTNAVADNCNSLLVNGIAQTAGAIGMSVGDTTASAASIAAGINAYVPGAGPNYRAKSIGPMVIATSDTVGSGSNGDAVAIAFSGASTATTTDVGAGRAPGEFPVRIWLDVSNSASETVMGPNAVEITDWVTHRGIESARLKQSINVVASTLVFERMGNEMTIEAQLNGTITDIISIGVLDLDKITVTGNGVHTQTLTASATIGVNGSAALTTALTNVTLVYDLANTKWNETSRSIVVDPALLRENGVAIPLQEGVFQLTPAGGTATITPGATGVSAFPGIVYEHGISLLGGPIILGSDLEFTIDATSAMNGDAGFISGNSVSIDLNGNAINFSGPTGVIATMPSQMADSGMWNARWEVLDTVSIPPLVGWSLVPIFSNLHTEFLETDMYQNASVTNDKLATGIDGAKVSAGTLPEAGLTVAVQNKLNSVNDAGAPAIANITGVNGITYFWDLSAGNFVATLPPIATSTYQRITFIKIDTSTNTGTISGDATIAGNPNIVLRDQFDAVTFKGDGTKWSIAAQYPPKPLPCTISITGLTTLDLTAANRRCSVVNVTSGNATEAIDEILNGPIDHDIEIRPETGLVLTLTGTAIAGNVPNSIALQAATLVLDGDLFEVARLRWNGNLFVFQDTNQGIV